MLLDRAVGLIGRHKGGGIEYVQAFRQLRDAAELLREIGLLGPRRPGIALDRWVRMNANDRKTLIAQTIEFYEIHKGLVDRVFGSCGASVGHVVDVRLSDDFG